MLDQIPGYREAVDRENSVRALAFLGVNDQVLGIDVRCITVSDWIALDYVGCPYVCGGTPDIADAALMLWRLSPRYRPGSRLGRWLHTRKVRNLVRRVGKLRVIAAARDYVLDSFQDSPGGAGNALSVPSVHWAVYLVGVLARTFSWSPDNILQMPVSQAFQFMRHIELANNPKAVLFNPSDRVRGEWLRQQNQANQ